MYKYKKVKLLGKGGFGAAILVQSREDRRKQLVIKEVKISALSKKEVDDAKREAAFLKELKHQNIVSYIESFVDKAAGKLCIVMDFADGGDLHQLLEKVRKRKRAPLDEDEVMSYFVQCCLAVRHIHDRRIIHRDLKSQNVFLTKRGIIKLGDFGIAAKLAHTNAMQRTQIGTPLYLSPELCAEKPYSRSTDVWSLGCVLYEMMALRVPFQAQSLPALVNKIMRGSYPRPPARFSGDCHALVASMLQKDPKRRPSIHDVLAQPIVMKHMEALQAALMRRAPGENVPSHTMKRPAAAPAEKVPRPIAAAAAAAKPSPSDAERRAALARRQAAADAVAVQAQREAQRKADQRKAQVEAFAARAAAEVQAQAAVQARLDRERDARRQAKAREKAERDAAKRRRIAARAQAERERRRAMREDQARAAQEKAQVAAVKMQAKEREVAKEQLKQWVQREKEREKELEAAAAKRNEEYARRRAQAQAAEEARAARLELEAKEAVKAAREAENRHKELQARAAVQAAAERAAVMPAGGGAYRAAPGGAQVPSPAEQAKEALARDRRRVDAQARADAAAKQQFVDAYWENRHMRERIKQRVEAQLGRGAGAAAAARAGGPSPSPVLEVGPAAGRPGHGRSESSGEDRRDAVKKAAEDRKKAEQEAYEARLREAHLQAQRDRLRLQQQKLRAAEEGSAPERSPAVVDDLPHARSHDAAPSSGSPSGSPDPSLSSGPSESSLDSVRARKKAERELARRREEALLAEERLRLHQERKMLRLRMQQLAQHYEEDEGGEDEPEPQGSDDPSDQNEGQPREPSREARSAEPEGAGEGKGADSDDEEGEQPARERARSSPPSDAAGPLPVRKDSAGAGSQADSGDDEELLEEFRGEKPGEDGMGALQRAAMRRMKKARSSGRIVKKGSKARKGSSKEGSGSRTPKGSERPAGRDSSRTPQAGDGGIRVPSSASGSRSSSRSRREHPDRRAKSDRKPPRVAAGIASRSRRAAESSGRVSRPDGEIPPWKAKSKRSAGRQPGLEGMATAAMPGNTQVRQALRQVRGALRDVRAGSGDSPSPKPPASSGAGAATPSEESAPAGRAGRDDRNSPADDDLDQSEVAEVDDAEEEEELVEHEVDAGDMGDDLMVALAQARRRRLEKRDGAEVDTPAPGDKIDEADDEGEGEDEEQYDSSAGGTGKSVGFSGPASAVLAAGGEAVQALPSPQIARPSQGVATGAESRRRVGAGTGFAASTAGSGGRSSSGGSGSGYVYEEDSESSDDDEGQEGDDEQRQADSQGHGGGGSDSGGRQSRGFGKVTIRLGIQAAIEAETRKRVAAKGCADEGEVGLPQQSGQPRGADGSSSSDAGRPGAIRAPGQGRSRSEASSAADETPSSQGAQEWIPGLVLPPELLDQLGPSPAASRASSDGGAASTPASDGSGGASAELERLRVGLGQYLGEEVFLRAYNASRRSADKQESDSLALQRLERAFRGDHGTAEYFQPFLKALIRCEDQYL